MIMEYFEIEIVSQQAFFIDYPLSCNVYTRLKWEQTEGRVLTMSGLGSCEKKTHLRACVSARTSTVS